MGAAACGSVKCERPIVDLQSDEARERIMRLFRASQVGSCVNSVTHDINNYLGAILAYADLLGMGGGMGPESQRMLNQITDAVHKSSSVVTALTSIARKERPDTSMIDVARMCEQVVEIRRYDLRTSQIALETIYQDGIPSIVGDLPKLKMALVCLIANAAEATEGVQPRRTRLRALGADDGVEIVLWNCGPLIPEDERERVFEPFYTTKLSPHLGLGLPTARDIARHHGGDLIYDPDRGFILRLPRKSPLTHQL
jgi:signal transduction histidine kinase